MTFTRTGKMAAGWALFAVLGFAIAFGVAASKAPISRDDSRDEATVAIATVNGEPLDLREYRAIVRTERAGVFAYFQGKYGAEDDKDFWTRSYAGEIPLEKLKEEALRTAVGIKTLQLLGKENGLLADASYAAFLQELRTENARRKEEIAHGRPIYGPKQWEEAAYYERKLADLRQQLGKKLGDEAFARLAEDKAMRAEVNVNEALLRTLGAKRLW
ncbi:MAG: hypothetical protein J7639_14230 [Paenibacillaceae bacterium]|nr:hypothetical protein [Paenibacillaceae bacterium]